MNLSQRLINKCLDLASNNKIFEMAFDRKYVFNKVDSYSHTIFLHLIKVAVFKVESTWTKELLNRFIEINDLRIKGNKKLSSDDYYKILYIGLIHGTDNVERKIKSLLVSKDYLSMYSIYRGKSLNKSTINNITEAISILIEQISIMISEDTFNDNDCEEIINIYFESMRDM